MNQQTDGWTHSRTYGYMDRQMDGHTVGHIDIWTDRKLHNLNIEYIFAQNNLPVFKWSTSNVTAPHYGQVHCISYCILHVFSLSLSL